MPETFFALHKVVVKETSITLVFHYLPAHVQAKPATKSANIDFLPGGQY